MSGNSPTRLPTRFLEKVWGATDLSPWYDSGGRKIGEVWFETDLPLLVKFIFTTENLSVQVHPGDAFAALHENSRGKTEMWYVLRADPNARIGIGLRETMTADRLRAASVSGEIETLMHWVKVKTGDVFFIPAGTVHAIGGGLAMCEIQQQSDVTYRLYDYGRPRELHLDKAIQVTSMEACGCEPALLPVECEYFHTEAMEVSAPVEYQPDAKRFHLLIFLSGEGKLKGQPFQAGEAWLIPQSAQPFSIEPEGPAKLLRTWVP